MFKQVSIYKISGVNFAALRDDFKKAPFSSCGPTQEASQGWVPPRGHEHGDLVEHVAGATIVKLMIETKAVPGDALREAADAKIKEIEAATGRKPGKKEKRDLMDELRLSMLPNAFAKRSTVTGWITADGFLVLDSASQARSDAFISKLFKTTEGLTVSMLQTTTSPQAAMTQWLLAESPDDWPGELSVERETVLKSSGDDAAIVKFSKHHLSNPDVRKHVLEGKLPTELALSWYGRVSFVLTETLKLKKVQFLDGVMDASGTDTHEDRFDADVALSTGLLRPLINALIDAMGGQSTEGAAA